MRVRSLIPRDLPGLHARFRELCRPVSHGFPPGFDEFAQPLLADAPHLVSSTVLVVEEDSEAAAFVRVGVAASISRWTLADPGDSLLFGPFCLAADGSAGTELLLAALRHAGQRQAVWAFDPSEAMCMPAFNGGLGLLPEQLPHIAHILAGQGFRVQHRELCMEARRGPAHPPCAAPLGLDLRRANRNGECAVGLYEPDGQRVGECRYSLMNTRRSLHEDARYTGYIDALSVVERYQGCGLGRMLLAEALRDLAEMGAAAVRLTTGASNLRAQSLYYWSGFALTGSCVTMKLGTERCW